MRGASAPLLRAGAHHVGIRTLYCFRSVGPCCYRCSRPWHRIILICSGQDNSANNSAVMRFSRTKSSVAGTSYRERKMPRNNPYFLLVAQNAGNLGMREVFRSRPTSSAWPVGTQSAVLRSVTHPSHAGCGRSGYFQMCLMQWLVTMSYSRVWQLTTLAGFGEAASARYSFNTAPIVIGFSNGAIMAASLLLRAPRAPGGCDPIPTTLTISGSPADPPGCSASPDHRR